MAKKTRLQLKQQHLKRIKIVPGGPTNLNRGATFLELLDDLADSALMAEDLEDQASSSPLLSFDYDEEVPANQMRRMVDGAVWVTKQLTPAGLGPPPLGTDWHLYWERFKGALLPEDAARLAELEADLSQVEQDVINVQGEVDEVEYQVELLKNSPRRLPNSSGVLLWIDSQPRGVFPTLAAAADYAFLFTPFSGQVLYQVYGTVGTPTTVQYVKQSATVQLMAGSKLQASLFACHYSNESQGLRTIRIVGEGELAADIDNFAFAGGLHLEVECAKWTGQLRHSTQITAARVEYWFKGVRGTAPAGKPTVDIRYRFGGNYKTDALVWFDGCILNNADSDLVVVRGMGTANGVPDGSGAGPGEADATSVVRLTKTTTYLAPDKVLLNQSQGTGTLEQDTPTGGGEGGNVDLSNYFTKPQTVAGFAPKKVPVIDSPNVVFTQEAFYRTRLSGTFSVDATGAVPGTIVWAGVGPSGTEPAISAAYVKRFGSFQTGKTNRYAFLVRDDASLEYYILSE